jgi:hypothetical protein
LRTLYQEVDAPFTEQQSVTTDTLVTILQACVRDAEEAVISDAGYLRIMGFPDQHCRAAELWRHLIRTSMRNQPEQRKSSFQALQIMLDHGPLARRILRAVGRKYSKNRLAEVYGKLCECLEAGQMFLGME